jgi:hypothetical protein
MTIIYNDKTKKYEVRCYYKDITGKLKQKTKRGFKSERMAMKWEKEFKLQTELDLSMPFDKFVEVYLNDKKPRLKISTWVNKKKLFDLKIIPFFKNKPIMDIKSIDFIQWQNWLITYRDKNDKPYSQTYLCTINNQLNALFNHAVNFYDLQSNIVRKVGALVKRKPVKCKYGHQQNIKNSLNMLLINQNHSMLMKYFIGLVLEKENY